MTNLSTELAWLAEAATPGPWAHRPMEYDDWGTVRAAYRSEDGFQHFICRCNYDATPEELTDHRVNGTDPAEPNAELIVTLRNAVPEILTALRAQQHAEALAEALDEVAGELEAEVEAKRGSVLPRTTERDLLSVRSARAALAAYRSVKP